MPVPTSTRTPTWSAEVFVKNTKKIGKITSKGNNKFSTGKK